MMRKPTISQARSAAGSGALAASGLFASVASSAPPASAVTPQLIEAARKEGKVVYYTSIDLRLRSASPRHSRRNIPALPCGSNGRSGSVCSQRIGQEYASRIHAVDVVNSSDAAHFITWKREGILEPYLPEDVRQILSGRAPRIAMACFASFRAWVCVIGYNTAMVQRGCSQGLCRSARPEMDGQDGQGASRLTAAPSMTATIRWRAISLGIFAKLAKRR